MPDHEGPKTYQEYIHSLWGQLEQNAEPRTLSQIIAAESYWMQVPDGEAAAAKPDLAEIDGWAEKIERSPAFQRLLTKTEKLNERLEKHDAEGLMTDLLNELRPPERESAPERERAGPEKEQERAQTGPEKQAPAAPTL